MTVSLILFVFGLAIGSFLNVASLRYGTPVKSRRSRCPLCGQTLNWYELIPVFSFFAQLGKCRHCRGRISRQYPIVELSTALVFAALSFFQLFGGETSKILELAIWLVAASVLIFIAAVDWRLFIIPDGANITLAILGFILAFAHGDYLPRLLSAAGAVLFFGGIVFLTRGKGMGIGDVKLAGALGLLLGWPDIVSALMAAFIIGALFGIGLILLGKKSMKDAVPFGPFLVIGTFVALFFGNQLLSWLAC